MKQNRKGTKGSASARKPAGAKQDINDKVLEELARFIEYHPAGRLSRNLRTMLMEFLTYEGATEAGYLQDLLYDLQGLFEFLEIIQQNPESNDK